MTMELKQSKTTLPLSKTYKPMSARKCPQLLRNLVPSASSGCKEEKVYFSYITESWGCQVVYHLYTNALEPKEKSNT